MSDQYDYRTRPPKMVHADGRSVLAMADGLTRMPPYRFSFDCRGLTEAEYMRVVAWRSKLRGWHVVQLAPEGDAA